MPRHVRPSAGAAFAGGVVAPCRQPGLVEEVQLSRSVLLLPAVHREGPSSSLTSEFGPSSSTPAGSGLC